MTVDRLPDLRLEDKVELREAGFQGVAVRGREGWEVLDARRERFSLAAQAPLLWMVPEAAVEGRSRRRLLRTAG